MRALVPNNISVEYLLNLNPKRSIFILKLSFAILNLYFHCCTSDLSSFARICHVQNRCYEGKKEKKKKELSPIEHSFVFQFGFSRPEENEERALGGWRRV